MGIRPVDMQVIVHKTQEIHPAKQTIVSKQDNELMQAQSQNKQETIKKSQTVNELEQKDLNKVKNDEKKETQGDQKKKKKKKGDQDSEEESTLESKKNMTLNQPGSHFDMKV